MDTILFPAQYKKALLNRTKNSTIRISNEKGKYKVGKTYIAKSYAGNDLGVKIKILQIISTTLKGLADYGIPQRSIEATKNKTKITLNSKVELIKFKVILF